ncbi:S26 family signal peptidase [Nitrosomonas halophila]|uniref:Conjugal transfer pilin signal peptidase TrbI n=1 Tax=Nitrosomonas halophila TaxID=44576 RepID=A0A1H3MI65_9PROT|nr:S26 family signal peptidase [Nitrosomonas halophila]SDY75775.1 conjugal transfer pilin signal peptidase TrbI [Nitrosomonas halophila]
MADTLYAHISRLLPLYLWLLVGCIAVGRSYLLAFNLSDSLPGTIFLIQKEKGLNPRPGERVAFLYGGGGPYGAGTVFVKIVKGVSGSYVTAKAVEAGGYDYFVDEAFVGRSKPLSKTGFPLKKGPIGQIPRHHYYLTAPHPDSLDSRYAWVGWVARDRIIGRAYRIF